MNRVDFDAGHQLGLFDRLLDRFDGGLEVDDHAAADAARFGDAEADDVEAVAIEHLADHRRHLGRADVETDQIPFFTCQLYLRLRFDVGHCIRPNDRDDQHDEASGFLVRRRGRT